MIEAINAVARTALFVAQVRNAALARGAGVVASIIELSDWTASPRLARKSERGLWPALFVLKER